MVYNQEVNYLIETNSLYVCVGSVGSVSDAEGTETTLILPLLPQSNLNQGGSEQPHGHSFNKRMLNATYQTRCRGCNTEQNHCPARTARSVKERDINQNYYINTPLQS